MKVIKGVRKGGSRMHALLNNDHHSVQKHDKFGFRLCFSFSNKCSTYCLLSKTKPVICTETSAELGLQIQKICLQHKSVALA